MSNFLLVLAELSIAAAIFFGIYQLVVKLFKRRITKQCRYILCLLVALRMLIPFGVNMEIPWATIGENLLGPMPEKAADVVILKENVTEDFYGEQSLGIQIDAGMQANGTLVDEPMSSSFPENKDKRYTAGIAAENTVGLQGISIHAANNFKTNLSGLLDRWEIPIFALWLLGVIVCFVYYEAGYLRWKWMVLKGCRPAEPEDRELLKQMYPKGRVNMLQSNQVNTPLLCGAICPHLILPEGGFVKNKKKNTLEHIFRHEMYHVKRKDLIWKHFAILGRSIHWFNPFLYSFCGELSRCCELSCDEAVTQNMDKKAARAYGETILMLASSSLTKTPVPVNGFSQEKEELKERLEGIMNNRKMSGRVLALSLALVLVMSGCGTLLAPEQNVLADTVNALLPEEGKKEMPVGNEESEVTGQNESIEMENAEGSLVDDYETNEAVMSDSEEMSQEELAQREDNPLLLSEVQRESSLRWKRDDGTVVYDAYDTMYIMAAGQKTKLVVEDVENRFSHSDEPAYDIHKFVTLASKALDHLYGLSGYRNDSWNVFWSSCWNSIAFSITDNPEKECIFWITYGEGYGEAILGEDMSEIGISNMGLVFSEREACSPISWDDMKKPDNYSFMSKEEVAQWYYENYLIYDGPNVKTIQMIDDGTVEIYTVDGTVFHVNFVNDGKVFQDIYGPYPER